MEWVQAVIDYTRKHKPYKKAVHILQNLKTEKEKEERLKEEMRNQVEEETKEEVCILYHVLFFWCLFSPLIYFTCCRIFDQTRLE